MSDSAQPLSGVLFGDPDVSRHLSNVATVQAMLDVEAALAEAQAALSVIPSTAVAPIAHAARADQLDLAALARDAAVDGNLAIPLVRQLRARVALRDVHAAEWVHFGATSQDIIDTGLVLQLRAAVPIIAARLDRIAAAARTLAAAHAETPMAGRTWLRQATPVTFGLVAAGWADSIARVAQSLGAALEHALVVQLGGASGTLAAMGPRGIAVLDELARRLALAAPALAWHAHRDRLVTLACAHGVVCGALGKIARDIALLGQTEIAEVDLPRGGGSSTMPHKQNPVGCAVALAAATRAPGLVATLLAAMPQELERGLGGWHAEWETIADLVAITGGAARAVDEMLSGLDLDAARMKQNLALTRGANLAEAVAFALTPHLGREQAHAAVARAAARAASDDRAFVDVLLDDPSIAAAADRKTLEKLVDPAHYLGAASALVDRVLRASQPARE